MTDKCKMLRMIHALDFSIKEMELYLDVHPANRKALNLINDLRRKREMAVMTYEKMYGKYIVTTHDSVGTDNWEWINSPWPWETKECEM